MAEIDAFAAAGLASDHEVMSPEEAFGQAAAWPVRRNPHPQPAEIVAVSWRQGLADWSQMAFATDDRSASHTLQQGATDGNVRAGHRSRLARPKSPIQCRRTINPARHMRLTPYVGSVSAGRMPT